MKKFTDHLKKLLILILLGSFVMATFKFSCFAMNLV